MTFESRNFLVGINAVPLLSPWTGIGQYTYHLIAGIQKILYNKPSLFYAGGWSNELRHQPLPSSHITFKTLMKRFVPYSYHLNQWTQQKVFTHGVNKEKINLYHEPNYVSFNFDGPTIITVHDLSYIRYASSHPKNRVRHLEKGVARSQEKADHIIVDSEFIKKEMISYYNTPEHKISVIPLGVSTTFHPRSLNTCIANLKQYQLQYQHYFLAVGTLEPRKNLSLILDAYSTLPIQIKNRYPLVLIGTKSVTVESFDLRIQKLMKNNQVKLLGYMQQNHIPILYAGASVFLYPSLYEGFGLPPLEAMASGVPVITSNCSALPEVVENAGMQLEAESIDAWRDAMMEFIENQSIKLQYIEKGKLRAKQFSWEKCALNTANVYQQFVQ